MIANATLVGITPPATPDRFGGEAASAEVLCPAGTRCTVEAARERRSGTSNVIAEATDLLYVLVGITPAPRQDGTLRYRLDGDGLDQVRRIAKLETLRHGRLSHYELTLKAAR